MHESLTSSDCDPPPAHVLVVDDERQILEVLRRLLESAGYRASVAETIDEAREAMDAAHFDVAVVDVGMPSVSGPELGLELARDGIQVIYMSGHPDRAVGHHRVLEEALFLPKPFEQGALVDLVELALWRARG